MREPNSIETPIQSPCIDNCCLDDHDICLGCFRDKSEIIHWTKADNTEKQIILDRCELRRKHK